MQISLPSRSMLKYTHKTRLELDWLEWVAPDSASTISTLSMTYSTPASLVRAGQGVFYAYFSFSSWVHLAKLKHPLTSLEHWLVLWVQGQRPPALPSGLKLCLLFFSYFFRSCSSLSISPLTTDLKSCTCLYIFSHSFPAIPASWAKQYHWGHRSCMPPPPPLPMSCKQWWWLNRQDHPRLQGKGIGQAPWRELIQVEGISWTWPKTSPS